MKAVTELRLVGEDMGELADFLECLDEAGRDLSVMIYRSAFVNWKMPSSLLDDEVVRDPETGESRRVQAG
jgi:hypothetical protein